MMNEQEILSKIAFIKLVQKNYKGDGLDLTQGDIALVSNEKCYRLMQHFPGKFEKMDFNDIPTDTLKYIYDNRNKLVEKDNGRLIYDSTLYSLLVENSLNLKENSEMIIPGEKEITEPVVDNEANSKKSRKIFVIYGRNEKARKALFQFLRSIDLEPLEWSQLIAETGKGSPYIGEILDSAFQTAQAVIVLMTGDDLAKLRDIYLIKDEKLEEFTPQARPNVLFESGMAFGRNPEKTIIVELGKTRKYSDIAGRHVIRIDNSPEKRNALVERLRDVGCSVKTEGKDDWYKDGDFEAALPPEYVSAEVNPVILSGKREENESDSLLKTEVSPLNKTESLSEDKEKILKFLNAKDDRRTTAGEIYEFLGIDKGRTQHYLNQLVRSEHIHDYISYREPTTYGIIEKGLEYLVDNDII